MVDLIYVLPILAMGVLAMSLIAAWAWARRDGQFRDFEAGSRVIFDADEPEGVVTDTYPSHTPATPRNN